MLQKKKKAKKPQPFRLVVVYINIIIFAANNHAVSRYRVETCDAFKNLGDTILDQHVIKLIALSTPASRNIQTQNTLLIFQFSFLKYHYPFFILVFPAKNEAKSEEYCNVMYVCVEFERR